MLKYREIFYNKEIEDENEPNHFITMHNILHPRERMIQFQCLHKKLYTNSRLHKFRLIESPYCHTCPDQIEDQDHLMAYCPRSNQAWRCLEEEKSHQINIDEINFGSTDKRINNFISLIKHTIYQNRDKAINVPLLRARLNLRESDQAIIRHRKTNRLR